MTQINNLENIVKNGLCIGCGLCQSITGKDYIKISPSKKNKIKVIGPMSKKLSDFGGESLLKKTLHACLSIE